MNSKDSDEIDYTHYCPRCLKGEGCSEYEESIEHAPYCKDCAERLFDGESDER